MRPISVEGLPSEPAHPPVAAYEYSDAGGTHVLVLGELRSFSPVETVYHRIEHYVRRSSGLELRWVGQTMSECDHLQRVMREAPIRTDVDGDGASEVSGWVVQTCTRDAQSVPFWAYEDDRDLFWRSDNECFGDGFLPTSVRGTPLEAHARARWRQLIRFDTRAEPAVVSAARAAATATPIGRGVPSGAVLEDALRWRDRSGEHGLVLSQVPSRWLTDGSGRELHAVVLDRRGRSWTQRHAFEGRDLPDGDCGTAFHPSTFDLTDLDGDGVQEVTFGWVVGCTTDVSPLDAKLFIVEGRDAHVVHGNTYLGVHDPDCDPPRPLIFEDDPMHLRRSELLERTRPLADEVRRRLRAP